MRAPRLSSGSRPSSTKRVSADQGLSTAPIAWASGLFGSSFGGCASSQARLTGLGLRGLSLELIQGPDLDERLLGKPRGPPLLATSKNLRPAADLAPGGVGEEPIIAAIRSGEEIPAPVGEPGRGVGARAGLGEVVDHEPAGRALGLQRHRWAGGHLPALPLPGAHRVAARIRAAAQCPRGATGPLADAAAGGRRTSRPPRGRRPPARGARWPPRPHTGDPPISAGGSAAERGGHLVELLGDPGSDDRAHPAARRPALGRLAQLEDLDLAGQMLGPRLASGACAWVGRDPHSALSSLASKGSACCSLGRSRFAPHPRRWSGASWNCTAARLSGSAAFSALSAWFSARASLSLRRAVYHTRALGFLPLQREGFDQATRSGATGASLRALGSTPSSRSLRSDPLISQAFGQRRKRPRSRRL